MSPYIQICRLGLIVSALLCLPALAQDPLEAPRNQFNQHFERIEVETVQARTAAILRYSNALAQVAERYQKEGDLDALLEVLNDIALFERVRAIPMQVRSQSPERVRSVHKAISADFDAAEASRRQSIIKLVENYVNYLETMKRKLTTDGNLEGALAVRAEIDRVKNIDAYTAAQFESAASRPQAPVVTPAVSQRAVEPRGQDPENARSIKFRIGERGFSSPTHGLRFDGAAEMQGRTMVFGGGRIVLADSGENIKQGFSGSNALTIEAIIVPDSLNQKGPARIIGSSLDGYSRNFSLCQEGANLVLRLRTTKNSNNGTSPEVVLGRMSEGQTHHVIVTYRPGTLKFYLDGRAINVKTLDGDFSNWDAYPLVFGNEYKDDRPWKGRLRLASIENVFLSAGEVVKRSLAIRGRPPRSDLKNAGGFNGGRDLKKRLRDRSDRLRLGK